MFPSSLFPTSLFPGALFPGASKVGPSPVLPNPFEVDLLAYLEANGVMVYPDKIPQGQGPPASSACVFVLISDIPYYKLKGAAGLTAKTYQFSFYSLLKSDTVTLELSVRALLSGYRGVMGTSLVSSCRVQNALDLPYEANVDDSDDGTYHRVVEYRFLVKESIPTFP